MHAFWPIFFAVIVTSESCLVGEITLALNWKLIDGFLKGIRTKRPLPHNGRSLPSPLSSPSAETLSSRQPSRHYYSNEILILKLVAMHLAMHIYRRRQVSYPLCGGVNAPKKPMPAEKLILKDTKNTIENQTANAISNQTKKPI
jgi:hypothetical protein